MLEKYRGRTDLVDCDEFWADVLKENYNHNIVLPMESTPENVRVLHEMLECPPGECGQCCRYGQTPVSQYDIHRMLKIKTMDELQQIVYTSPTGMFMRGDPPGAPCPLLENESCTIYQFRPDACWLFPVQQAVKNIDGVRLVQYRIRCEPGVNVIRQVLKGALHGENKILTHELRIQEA